MSFFSANLTNQYKFKNQIVFSARFGKQDEDGQKLDEIDLYIKLGFNRSSTPNTFDNINVRFQ